MKKVLIAFILFTFIGTGLPTAKAANSIKPSKTIIQQTDSLRHKVYKKRRRVTRRVSSQKAARIQMQLRQADKHLREEQKVQKVQQELKKDTVLHN